jgi:hypothetical protein
MSFNFVRKTASPSTSPTVANVQVGDSFQTDFGTIYTKLADGSFLKVGNPDVPSHNEVRVKPASYFNSTRPVTLLGTLQIAF